MSNIKFEQQLRRTRRKEIMKELEELNQGNRVFDIVTGNLRHEEMIKKIEGRVAGFFKNGFEQRDFEYYLFNELGDLTRVDKLLGPRILSVYDDTGLKKNDFQYKVTNVYVEYAVKLVKRMRREAKNRVGVDPELGEYQRNVRDGIKKLENKLGTGERERIIKLYPELTYSNKLDIDQIREVWGKDGRPLTRTATLNHLKKFTSEEYGKVLLTEKKGRKLVYYFNPKYVFMGKGKKRVEYDVKVYLKFLKNIIEKVEVLESALAKQMGVKTLTHSALATLHAIIPYFHYERCYAVRNPLQRTTLENETVWEATSRERKEGISSGLEYLSILDISRMVAKKENERTLILRDLEILERAEAIVYTNNTILINPKLMWSKNDKLHNGDRYTEHIEEIFFREKEAREQKGDKEWRKKFLKMAEKRKEKSKQKNQELGE